VNPTAGTDQPDAIYARFAATARRFADRPALLYKQDGEYRTITYGETLQAVAETAAGLASRDVKPGDRVAIYSYNRPEWIVTDLAVARLGAVLVPVYHTLPEDSVRYILNDAEVGLVIAETPELFAVVRRVVTDLPLLRHVVTLFPAPDAADTGARVKLCDYASLRREGAAALARAPAAAHPARPDDLFTLCYTSGTTGEPKGAMLTHRNILSNVTTAIRLFSINEHDVLVSFLPLCHMFERTCGHYSVLLAGGAVAYAESVQTVAQDVQKVRPTIMIVVPRVLEKVYATVQERVLAGPWHKRMLMIETLRTYSQYARRKAARRSIGLGLALRHWLLGRLVVSKLVKLGGGRLRLLVSGSAPLERRLARTIRNLGFNLLEGYGLTETSPVACAQVPGEEVVGTVGKPFDGVDVRIGANDEILIRGPNVMKGYFKKPEETARAIDRDGWFHTGDQGRFDEKGNLVITGRLKEIIVTSYGKNLAPVPIELAIAGSKYVEQAVVHGDRRPYLVALVVPARLALEAYARAEGIEFKEFCELLDHPRILELYRDEISRALTGFAQYEQVRKFRLIPEPFTVENGLLTPSLKVRRPNVVAAYQEELDKLYGS
jgi:long-chain acyl-CoA synthetase